MKTETFPGPDLAAYDYDSTEQMEQHELSETARTALGHIALGEQPKDDYIADGLKDLEAHANGETATPDTRIHDIEAAHEAAKIENEIFNIYDQAAEENKMFDLYTEALTEDTERSQNKPQPEQPAEQAKDTTANDTTSVKKEHNPLKTESPQEIRQEAAAALKQAGLPEQLAADNQVSKDIDGNMVIVNGGNATVITRQIGNVPLVTEYSFDKDKGTITVSSPGTQTLTGHIMKYEPTQMKQWQTHDQIINLPPTLAKRFGVEQAALVAA